MKCETPKVKVNAMVVVRDKDGNPKFDDIEKVKQFRKYLTEEDMIYLEKKYGKDIYAD